MKKLMIVAAVALAASFANAAAGSWATGDVYYGGIGSQLKDSGGDAVGAETTVYLFAGLTAGQYGALTDAKTIFSIFTEGDAWEPDMDSGVLDFGEGGKVYSTDAWNFDGGNNYGSSPVYAAVVALVHDEDGEVIAYSANSMYGSFDDGALAIGNVDRVALGWGEGATGTATTWQSVPEPTSGLLLLLGVAGLALRRRRA